MSISGRELRVLHIEVSEDDAFLARRALERGGLRVNFKRVETLPDFESQLEARRWDVVLSDYDAKGFGAQDALRILAAYRKATNSSTIPFIVLAGSIGEDTTANLMRRGAHDYINKNKLSHLVPAVERELIAARVRDHDAINVHDQYGAPRLHDAVFEVAPDPMLVLDDSGVIIELNSAALDLFDMGNESCLGKNITELTAWHSKLQVENALQQHRSGLSVRNTEIPVADRDQHEHLLLWSIAEVELLSVSRMLWLGRDITEMREQERSLVRQHKNEALLTFGMGLAHDLRKTFSDILQHTETAVGRNIPRNERDEALSRYHHGIHTAALAGRSLIHRITRLSDTSQTGKPHPGVPLHYLVQGTLLEFERQIPENIRLRSCIDGKHVVAASPSSFQEMLTNILTNATTAMGNDGGEIRLTAEEVPQQPLSARPRQLKFSVSDTGHGIAPEHLERVMDPYFTTISSCGTPGQAEELNEAGAPGVPGVYHHGVGLGLSVVQRLVTDMGGELSISSQPGQGCTVTVLLLAADRPDH